MEHILDRDALRAALRRRARRGTGGAVGRSLSLGDAVDAALPYGHGLAAAAVHGISSDDRERGLGFALTVASSSGGLVAWIAGAHPSPGVGQSSYGLPASRLLLVRAEAPEDVIWAAEEALRSGAASAVVIEASHWDHEELRRLEIAAGTGGGHGFCFLTAEVEVPRFPAFSTQWCVRDGSGARRSGSRFADPWWEVALFGSRGPSRTWSITWRMAAEALAAEEMTSSREEAFA